ncbi:MAG: glycerate kinase [Firmicutes bacterium]|jgi:glycerate kinase|nr:glycerate kinase [Bacillota bacterium]HPU01285.1 glycerate kinase [Bacillota bacterium]
MRTGCGKSGRKKIVVAPNAFKGSLDAPGVAAALARGVRAAGGGWEVVPLPLADGGDGTTACIVSATGGKMFKKTVTGPLGEPVEAFWGLAGDGSTAVVEVAAASGMARLPRKSLDPMRATSYGTGELILAALESGCRRLFLGLGGSATCDAGAGILQALGVELLDGAGRPLPRGGGSLKELATISHERLSPRLRGVELIVGYDVANTLYGPEGAAYVYAPQKGARPEQLPLLDEGLRHFADVVKKELGADIGTLRGGGAAGGIGAGLAGVLGAKLVPGAEEIMEIVGLRALLESGEVGLVITGEGEINAQTLYGKVPVAVSRMAKRFGVPVLVLAGGVKLDLEAARREGITTMLSITDGPMSLDEAMARTAELLESTARRVMELVRVNL